MFNYESIKIQLSSIKKMSNASGASHVFATLKRLAATDHFVLIKMARPRKDDIEKRIVQVNIRLTKDEADKVDEYSKASGISPANWIRQKVFTGRFPNPKLSPLDASIYQELRRIGVNLNQVTHQINLGERPVILMKLQLELEDLLKKIFKLLVHDRQPDQG